MSIESRMEQNYPLKHVTSLGVGGRAAYFFRPRNEEEIREAYGFAIKRNLPLVIMGYGTNLLIRDTGIYGLVLQIGDNLSGVRVEGQTIHAKAGCLLSSVSKLAAYHGLTGLEFAVGIPGGIGGACFMNAGAYGGEIGPFVQKLNWIKGETKGTFDAKDYTYSYRMSNLQQEELVVTEVTLQLAPGDKNQILAQMEDFQQQRRAKQPLEHKNAGSTFKRPKGHFVGPLLEQARLKGMRIGDAMVSPKHAGFIVNTGDATATDVLALIFHIQKVIDEQFGVKLDPEIRILGE